MPGNDRMYFSYANVIDWPSFSLYMHKSEIPLIPQRWPPPAPLSAIPHPSLLLWLVERSGWWTAVSVAFCSEAQVPLPSDAWCSLHRLRNISADIQMAMHAQLRRYKRAFVWWRPDGLAYEYTLAALGQRIISRNL